jgi:aspartate/methionine/tyrosine aminotransferase
VAGADDLATVLLQEAGVVVHPGSFYGIAEAGRVVVSLLGPTEEFADGVRRIQRGN